MEVWQFTLIQIRQLENYGKDISSMQKVGFHEASGKEVCEVRAEASSRVVYLKENADEWLYIRTGNAVQRLTVKEAVAYHGQRWG